LGNLKGGKTRFQQKFTEDMFLNALLIDSIKSTATIMSLVGCSRSTAKNMLYMLVNEGKVKKIEIEGGCHGWQKVKGD
jgi:predicted transcriptional regulator